MGHEKNSTGTTIYGRPRADFYVRTVWPGGRQNAGDAVTQLLCITAACTYRLMADGYVHKQQTSRTPRVKTSVNMIHVWTSVATRYL